MVERRAESVPPRMGVFVGRDRELTEISALLASGERMITVTGEPGIGKSRLAARLAEGWPQAAWVLDLSEARGEQDACHTLGQALGVSSDEDSGPGPEGGGAIARRLTRLGDALVVLDGCDRAAEALAPQLDAWLAGAPDVAVVATCRTPLRSRGEVLVELGPLELPAEGGATLDGEAASLMSLQMRRAGLRDELGEEDRRALCAVVRELDGNPLAIELAAARLSVLGPRELLARLSKRFEVLTHPGDRVPTLRHAIDLSWETLEPHEQDALCQCSVFRGGFTLEAAEAVIALEPTAPPVLDVLQSLRRHSLVSSGRPIAGVRRLGMSRSIRDYAAAHATETKRDAGARARHIAHFAVWGWHKHQHVDSSYGTAARAQLWSEQHNLLAAVEWQLDAPELDADRLLETLLALDVVLSTHGPMSTRRELLDRAIVRVEGLTPRTDLLARAHQARAHTARRGHSDEGIRDVEEALRLARSIDDRRLIARLLTDRGVQHNLVGDRDAAATCMREALGLVTEANDLAGENFVRVQLTYVLLEQGDAAEASQQARNAESAARALGDVRGQGMACYCRGLVHQDLGELDDAERAYREAIELLELLGERAFLTACLCQLGITLQERGRLHEAAELLERAHQEGTLDAWTDVLVLAHAAAIEAAQGRLETADAGLAAADALLRESDVPHLKDSVELIRCVADLARARERAREGQDAEPLRRRVVEHLRGLTAGGTRPPSMDVRVALRIVQRALGESMALPSAGSEQDELQVQIEGLWFRTPAGPMVSCKRRKEPTRRLLAHLATQRLTRPGEASSAKRLIEVGWPGERMILEAGLNRLYVTINGLRKAGLRELLLADRDGYLLDPTVNLRLVHARLPVGTR